MTKNTIAEADEVAAPSIEDDRTRLSVAGLMRAVADHLRYSVCRPPAVAALERADRIARSEGTR